MGLDISKIVSNKNTNTSMISSTNKAKRKVGRPKASVVDKRDFLVKTLLNESEKILLEKYCDEMSELEGRIVSKSEVIAKLIRSLETK
jgi:hypothetical protein